MATRITTEVLNKLFKIANTFLSSKYKSSDYSLTSFSIEPGSTQKDNYLSSIYSVKFTTLFKSESSKYNLIFKSQLITSEKFDDASEYFWNIIFVKEHLTYKIILEKMKELASGTLMCPGLHYFYTEAQDYSCFLLDNLIPMGYYIPKTQNGGLNFHEACLMMKTLANFHALSLGKLNLQFLILVYRMCI